MLDFLFIVRISLWVSRGMWWEHLPLQGDSQGTIGKQCFSAYHDSNVNMKPECVSH